MFKFFKPVPKPNYSKILIKTTLNEFKNKTTIKQ